MKKIGIVGGMGPLASLFYAQQLILKHPASKDQDQFHIVLDSNSSIPDRTRSLLEGEESPVDAIKESLAMLSNANVEIGFITCFTSHAFFNEFKESASFKLLNVFTLLKDSKQLDGHKVGLLATSGTLKTQLFQKALPHIEFILPSDEVQKDFVMKGIYDPNQGIKSNHIQEGQKLLQEAINYLIKDGATIILAGCTEVGLALDGYQGLITIVDPMMDMVHEIINQAQ
ncbi:MAG: aspartate/glutamate racemase family protein [Erysipelothrix sp.]|jgi:aspartate racemase|nr:aspartate/glutamate racemase family protein [Erysipelothrix sp.]